MKKVINGKRYNTETGTLLAKNKSTGRESYLYRTPRGAFFRYTETIWEGEHDSITPLTVAEAKELFELFNDPRLDWESAFNEIPAEPEPEPGRPPIYGEKMRQTAIWLPEEMAEWLKDQPGSISETLRGLIAQAMKADGR